MRRICSFDNSYFVKQKRLHLCSSLGFVSNEAAPQFVQVNSWLCFILSCNILVFYPLLTCVFPIQVFPQALAYNRLTGGFDEVQGLGTAMTGSGAVTPPYGITDEERERMLEWAKAERLPLFLRYVWPVGSMPGICRELCWLNMLK